jgi:hypothetical protein
MIAYLKGLGFKYTVKDTLNGKEFRLVEESVAISEELTTLGNTVTESTKVYELFLPTSGYSVAKIEGIVSGSNNNGDIIVSATADVEKQERGYLITLTFVIGD